MTRWELTIEHPLAKPLSSVANLREHWAVKAKRTKGHRALMAALIYARGRAFFREWGVMRSNEALRLLVHWTRIAPRSLDDDNLRGAFKALRDELAKHAGIDDRSPRYEWHYLQERGKPGFRVHLEVIGATDRE